ncbi:MAG: hypothetical protein Q9164_005537 [Protoblastenia rupestris]
MGDSYAAGIGAGRQIQYFDDFCFRYNQSYPRDLNNGLEPKPQKVNYVACSGEKFNKIIDNQFLDRPSTFGRPAWGDKPHFVTLTMGGNDIGFRELVTVCVYSIRIFTLADCEKVIKNAQMVVKSPDFVRGAKDVINKALAKGNAQVGPSFKVFVTGYAQFFNEQTTQCNDISFKPKYSLLKAQKLTIERRQALNKIARDLNSALQTAVEQAKIVHPDRVFYVDYDAQFEGHRFCDRTEPNPKDPETWFFNLESNDAATGEFLNSIPKIHRVMSGLSNDSISGRDYLQLITNAAGDDLEKRENGVSVYRVFHPKSVGHRTIERILRSTILSTRGSISSNSRVATT